jgi:hypothetical protein
LQGNTQKKRKNREATAIAVTATAIAAAAAAAAAAAVAAIAVAAIVTAIVTAKWTVSAKGNEKKRRNARKRKNLPRRRIIRKKRLRRKRRNRHEKLKLRTIPPKRPGHSLKREAALNFEIVRQMQKFEQICKRSEKCAEKKDIGNANKCTKREEWNGKGKAEETKARIMADQMDPQPSVHDL